MAKKAKSKKSKSAKAPSKKVPAKKAVSAKAGGPRATKRKPPATEAPSEDAYPDGDHASIRRVMMPKDTNAVGTIFGGTILAEIDLAAATEAHKHHPGMVVTVSMDKIDFKAPVYVGDLVSFFTRTVRIGRSSICVQVSVWAHRRFGGGSQVHVTEAQVTMVAVDTSFNPIPVGSLPG